MRLALLSDIHANLRALEACLQHAQAQGATQYAFLGDLVGYGAEPAAVVRRILGLKQDGAVVLKGNHDALAVAPHSSTTTMADSTAAWTHDQLGAELRASLDALPMTARLGRALLVHATADKPEAWRYAYDAQIASLSLDAARTQADVRYVFGGHVHRQSLYYRGTDDQLMAFAPTAGVPIPVPGHRYWLATIGSVGQPRDGDTRAMYALFDDQRSTLAFHRVDYDHQAAAHAIRAAGLPEYMAQRLEAGR
jgi:diadenosine tetraphosphatase ApaH/serine/threonine PP2A family protein phosphatase